MKIMIRNLAGLAFAGAMLCAANVTLAETATTTTTSEGTVTELSRDGIIIKTTTSSNPISYSSTKTTTYVDENGSPVAIETVKSGRPVTVFYDKDGSKMVATRVVVRKPALVDPAALANETTTTTTTQSEGTISQFGPDAIVIKTTTTSDPVSYSSTKTTTYVDESGNPVAIETVKSGLPVTVYYDKNGNKMVATKVVVRKTTTTTSPTP